MIEQWSADLKYDEILGGISLRCKAPEEPGRLRREWSFERTDAQE
jgi:hypothetical protein